jgi:hypothetical protein
LLQNQRTKKKPRTIVLSQNLFVHGILFSQLGLYNLMFKRIFPSHNVFASSTIYDSFRWNMKRLRIRI